MSEVQIKMIDISAYHGIETHTASLIVYPVVVELCLVNRAYHMTDMLVV